MGCTQMVHRENVHRGITLPAATSVIICDLELACTEYMYIRILFRIQSTLEVLGQSGNPDSYAFQTHCGLPVIHADAGIVGKTLI